MAQIVTASPDNGTYEQLTDALRPLAADGNEYATLWLLRLMLEPGRTAQITEEMFAEIKELVRGLVAIAREYGLV